MYRLDWAFQMEKELISWREQIAAKTHRCSFIPKTAQITEIPAISAISAAGTYSLITPLQLIF